MDFYADLDITGVETSSARQVGYVEVTVSVNGHDITEPVVYNVVPKCTTTDTLFFINAIGGLDSFTFLGGLDDNSGIDEQTTYSISTVTSAVSSQALPTARMPPYLSTD